MRSGFSSWEHCDHGTAVPSGHHRWPWANEHSADTLQDFCSEAMRNGSPELENPSRDAQEDVTGAKWVQFSSRFAFIPQCLCADKTWELSSDFSDQFLIPVTAVWRRDHKTQPVPSTPCYSLTHQPSHIHAEVGAGKSKNLGSLPLFQWETREIPSSSHWKSVSLHWKGFCRSYVVNEQRLKKKTTFFFPLNSSERKSVTRSQESVWRGIFLQHSGLWFILLVVTSSSHI